MAKRPKAKPPERSYHHGNLVDALITASVELIEANGVENLSLRDVSKRIGVSPGAPFRHFRNKTGLLTAVAEQSMSRLTEAVQRALTASGSADPVAMLGAIGHGYLDWALGNPTHFQIISSRTLIDFHASKTLVEQNEAIYRLMLDLMDKGQADGSIRSDAPAHDLVVNARAFAYGLARMAVDGHFQEWHIGGLPEDAARQALAFYVSMLGTQPGTSACRK